MEAPSAGRLLAGRGRLDYFSDVHKLRAHASYMDDVRHFVKILRLLINRNVMIDLDKQCSIIEKFIQVSIEKFKTDNKAVPKSIGVYCCPWAGWMTTNFNINKTLKETENNCPDFEFVEFDFLELEGWQEEYETENPTYKTNGLLIHYQPGTGDEKLNEVIFKYMEPIIVKLRANNESDFLLQMLDSNFIKQF